MNAFTAHTHTYSWQPIQDVNSQAMACNGSPNYGFKTPTDVIDVQAGQTVSAAWLHTLTSTFDFL